MIEGTGRWKAFEQVAIVGKKRKHFLIGGQFGRAGKEKKGAEYDSGPSMREERKAKERKW
ncbi:hypothetical protein CDL15_Pgr017742 [Punica granatum]|nr:hypothetical protein CDL15_Pgr017742 [Punica granatum]